jgi:sulfate permease, SulP family
LIIIVFIILFLNMNPAFASLLKANWKSGLTVALVSIPLSVSLAVASGTTPAVGIITAIWAGLIASIFGGSNYDIVGPAGALSGILGAYALTYGASTLPMLAIISGVIIFASYLFKLERYLVFVPASTIHGFTLGVGLILAFGQLNAAFGLEGLPKHAETIENIKESLMHLGSSDPVTTTVFLIGLTFLFLAIRFIPKVPGAIMLAPLGIALGYLTTRGLVDINLVTLAEKFPNISPTLFIKPTWTVNAVVVKTAITVALVAILETMLCAKIADGMTKTRYNQRKEMLGLSLANIGSGLMGGLPATAVLARTSLNVKSGATHRMSQSINSVSIILISFIFLSSFKFIPMAVIASILVFTAARMIEREHFIRMFHHERRSFFISMAVAFVTVYYDPIIGIMAGTAITLLLFVERLSKGQYDLVANKIGHGITASWSGETTPTLNEHCDTLVYSIKGQLAYINAQAHISRFAQGTNGYKHVVLRMRELYFIDLDGVDAFEEVVEVIRKQGKEVLVSSVNPLVEKSLLESKVYREMKSSGHVFGKAREALAHLGY